MNGPWTMTPLIIRLRLAAVPAGSCCAAEMQYYTTYPGGPIQKLARASFRSPLNSKFFHSLFITSIFGRMHGALNVDKKNN